MNRKSCAFESIVQRDILPGKKLIMDIKIIADNKNNSSKKSFYNNLSALTIISNATNYKWGFPLLILVHKEILSHIRADNQFVTS